VAKRDYQELTARVLGMTSPDQALPSDQGGQDFGIWLGHVMPKDTPEVVAALVARRNILLRKFGKAPIPSMQEYGVLIGKAKAYRQAMQGYEKDIRFLEGANKGQWDKWENYNGGDRDKDEKYEKWAMRSQDKLNNAMAQWAKASNRFEPELRQWADNFYSEARDTGDYESYLKFLAETQDFFFMHALNWPVQACISEADRKYHTYIIGGTGSGKSELIKVLIYGYVCQPKSAAVVVIDPHGDLCGQLAKWEYISGTDRLVYIDPFLHENHTPTLNPLDAVGASMSEKEVIAQQLVNAFEELLKGSSGNSLTVNMRALLLPCLLVLLDEGCHNLKDLQTFLNDDLNAEFVVMGRGSKRPSVRSFFETEFSEKSFALTKQSIRTKLQSLFNSGVFYGLVNGQTTVDLERAINDKKIILFNLAKGTIGEDASEAFGRFIIALIQGLALRRQKLDRRDRIPVHLFIDECQNYIGKSTINILEESRKYGVHLTLAQQVTGRGMTPEMRNVVINNTNLKFLGRTIDDQRMPKLLGVDAEDARKLDAGHFFCRGGSNPTFYVELHNDCLDDKKAMSASEWEKVKEAQKCYYRPMYESTTEEVDPNRDKKGAAKRELI